MTPIVLLPKLFLAGGAFLAALQAPTDSTVDNHTLAGDKISPSQIVTRSQWGTPMLPDGKGGYSLIAPVDKKLIEQSLWIPPVFGTRPAVEVAVPSAPAAEVPATTVTAPSDQSAASPVTPPSLPLPAASPAAVSQ
jgi:hypothetical protein